MMCDRVRVKVPATTANLGAGFDCLGVALDLYNRVQVVREDRHYRDKKPAMVQEAAAAFFLRVGKAFPFSFSIAGDVPASRGLGSSVTVRAGIVAGLNRMAGNPLTPAECLNMVADLEGHPDNAAPAFLGGFACCTEESILNVPVSASLVFVTAIPELELATSKARSVLPAKVPFTDAVHNLRNASLIAAAFASRRYEMVRGAFSDRLHQPYREKLMPFLPETIAAGESAGALGGFLSGAGSTVICMAKKGDSVPDKVAKAMKKVFAARKIAVKILELKADNQGLRVTGR